MLKKTTFSGFCCPLEAKTNFIEEKKKYICGHPTSLTLSGKHVMHKMELCFESSSSVPVKKYIFIKDNLINQIKEQ